MTSQVTFQPCVPPMFTTVYCGTLQPFRPPGKVYNHSTIRRGVNALKRAFRQMLADAKSNPIAPPPYRMPVISTDWPMDSAACLPKEKEAGAASFRGGDLRLDLCQGLVAALQPEGHLYHR